MGARGVTLPVNHRRVGAGACHRVKHKPGQFVASFQN